MSLLALLPCNWYSEVYSPKIEDYPFIFLKKFMFNEIVIVKRTGFAILSSCIVLVIIILGEYFATKNIFSCPTV